ncbi:MAG: HlyC/CorC family transporter [Chloroflexi bacterium]|nr:HlyC/CorC family transporter [Chloroflexota bacterium]
MDDITGFIIQFLLVFILILFNGLLSMSELAVVSSRKTRLQQQAEEGSSDAQAALRLVDEPTRFLSTVQVGITLVGTLSGAIGGAALANEFAGILQSFGVPPQVSNTLAFGLIVLFIAYLTLVIGELVPKRLAMSNPEGIARTVARPMQILSTITSPVVHLLSSSTEAVLRILRVKNSDDMLVTPEEITVMMEQGEQSGIFEEVETDIVESIFRLSDLRVDALMTPRTEIDWLDLDEPFEDNLRWVMESPHNNFPVARGDLDNVQGVLRGKDLLARVTDGVPFDLESLVQPAQFIPESMTAFQALEVLKGAYANMALVIDEFGGTTGLVTLFDVMEAMVGTISERGEPVEPEAVMREDGSWLVAGTMRIAQFKKLFELNTLTDEERAGYQTVGGFIMTHLGEVPKVGQVFEYDSWKFEVVDMDGLRVDKVIVSKPASAS